MWSNSKDVKQSFVLVRLATFVLLLSASLSAAQVTSGRMLLATVVNERGQPVVDIGADDFVVSEGAQEREVLDVHVADYPVVVLLDDTQDELTGNAIRDSARRFVERIGDRPIAIGTLSSPGRMIATFDEDRAHLLDHLLAAPLHGVPSTSPLPAMANGARLLRDTEAPFSVIVVVTASVIDAAQPIEGDLLALIAETKSFVHAVTLQPSASDVAAPRVPDLLRQLSEDTRGTYTPVFSSASFNMAVDRLADRLSAEMMVSYLVPPTAEAGEVRVGVKRPGARVVGVGVTK